MKKLFCLLLAAILVFGITACSSSQNADSADAGDTAEEAVSYGITATPCFILNHNGERLIIPGVFSTEEFENALKDMQSGEIEKKTFV